MNDETSPPVKATTTSTRVLESLLELGEANLTEIANDVGLSKSSVHNHLETLAHLEFIIKDDTTYRVSLRFLEIGSSVRNMFPFYHMGREEVDRLASSSGLVAGLAVLERQKGICLYSTTGQRVETGPVGEGEEVPLHASAPGKAMLAELSDDELDAVLNHQQLDQFTDQSIGTQSELRDELETVRTRGVASDRGEWQKDMHGLAAGISGLDGQLLGAIYVLSPSESMSGKRFQQDVPGLVISSANQIRKNIRDS